MKKKHIFFIGDTSTQMVDSPASYISLPEGTYIILIYTKNHEVSKSPDIQRQTFQQKGSNDS